MHNFLCTVSYHGKHFAGWVKQKKQETVQGTIERAIKKVTKSDDFKTIGASKTDAGVHALGQKFLLVLPFLPKIAGFLQAVNATLAPDIHIVKMETVPSNFHIRQCQQKTYEYRINLGAFSLFDNDFEYRITRSFDFALFQDALKLFIGEHDFAFFSGLNGSELDEIRTVRTVDNIFVTKHESKVTIIFQAKSFIRYQIRMMVGAAVACAQGKISLSEISDVLNKRQPKMKYIAPPQGLILKEIVY